MQRRREGLARRLGRAALLVEHGVDARLGPLAQLDDVLVVGVRDGRPRHALVLVLLLLAVEDRDEEELLQLLVGEVDAQLRSQR